MNRNSWVALAVALCVVPAWAQETGLSYVHLSRICAMAAGENYEAARLLAQGMDGE